MFEEKKNAIKVFTTPHVRETLFVEKISLYSCENIFHSSHSSLKYSLAQCNENYSDAPLQLHVSRLLQVLSLMNAESQYKQIDAVLSRFNRAINTRDKSCTNNNNNNNIKIINKLSNLSVLILAESRAHAYTQLSVLAPEAFNKHRAKYEIGYRVGPLQPTVDLLFPLDERKREQDRFLFLSTFLVVAI